MRTLVIGDIHGAKKALEQVLERSEYNSEKDQLIFLGDYVDGWSESAQVIEYLIELEKKAIIKPIFIKGNHDVWCQNWLEFGNADSMWLNQGGLTTQKSYYQMNNIESHIKFFRKLHSYYIDEDNKGFVHGGFTSYKGLGHESTQSNYYWDRILAINPSPKIYKNHKEIYIGHTSTMIWYASPDMPEYNDPNQLKGCEITIPINRHNIWNIDTGAGYEGKLTIIDAETKEYWQSDYVQELYVNERGR